MITASLIPSVLMFAPVSFAGVLQDVVEYKNQQSYQQNADLNSIPQAMNGFISAQNQNTANRLRLQQAQLELEMARREYAQEQNDIRQAQEKRRKDAEAENQRRTEAINEILAPLHYSYKDLFELTAFYVEGLRENNYHYLGEYLLWTEVSQKMFQVPVRFNQSAQSIRDTWDDNELTIEIKKLYLRAFNEFALAAESEIRGYQSGIAFWVANREFDKARAEKDLAFQDAISAVRKTRVFLLDVVGVEESNEVIKSLDANLVAMKKLWEDFTKAG